MKHQRKKMKKNKKKLTPEEMAKMLKVKVVVSGKKTGYLISENLCYVCKKNKETKEVFGEQICKECEKQMGEEMDSFDFISILHRRGKKWILSEIKKDGKRR